MQKKPTYEQLIAVLRKVRDRSFRYPDSDYYERCSCGRSPHNDPPHKPDCLTVEINDLLKRAEQT